MDIRQALAQDKELSFPGFSCKIEKEAGRGSNAIVYRARYADALHKSRYHHVLIKELFPYDPSGNIFRDGQGQICVTAEGRLTYEQHRQSFEAGNKIHLELLENSPDLIGTNLNTYHLNNTLYTVLGTNGGNNLEEVMKEPACRLRPCVQRMLRILDAVEVFHSHRLVHLDISPDNILLAGNGNRERALLIDYNSSVHLGLSGGIGEEEDFVFSLKPGYTAPEVRNGRTEEIGAWTDLYSVTAVFFRMITGEALTPMQMIRYTPPDVSDCLCMTEEPETVRVWVKQMLRKGLATLTHRRYQTVEEMRQDLTELLDRIDGVGITHWALWETGYRQARRVVEANPSLAHLKDGAVLFPSAVSSGDKTERLESLILEDGEESGWLLTGDGGMGKTTAMLRMMIFREQVYCRDSLAMIYLSLRDWRESDDHFILNSILANMRFKPETRDFESARKALTELMDTPLETRRGEMPSVLLLLDGLNEARGETQKLSEEILNISRLRGVRVLVSSRTEEQTLSYRVLQLNELMDDVVSDALARAGLLVPEHEGTRCLLRTPMMLSMYIETCRDAEEKPRMTDQHEMLEAYLRMLTGKEIRSVPEDTDLRWMTEAAVYAVLPEIAAETHRRGGALESAKLLPTVENCYKLLTGRFSQHLFPQWIGHTKAILGGCTTAEEWYGKIVHNLL